jgi:type I restriction enzyme S subunit
MASEWRDARIDEIAEKVAMGPFGSAIKVETFVSHGVPVISGQHLHGSTIDDNVGFNFVSEAHADRLRNANVRRGDVIFTHAGSIGQVAIVPESSRYERYVISQRQFYMRCDRAKVLPEYVVAYFKTPKGRHQLLANTSQVGVPSIAQPVSYLRTLAIPLPPLHEQRAIASVLGALDDKIDLNRRMCQTLKEMARALFQSWFVDFDPVRAKMEGRDPGLPKEIADLFPSRLVDSELGPIPEGWRMRTVAELCTSISSGGTPQRLNPEYWEGGTVPWFKTGELFDAPLIDSEEKITPAAVAKSACKLWPAGTILFALYASPTVGRMGVLTREGASNQAAAGLVVSPTIGVPFLLNALYFARPKLQQIAVGAAQQNINQGVLKSHPLLVPSNELAIRFSGFVQPALNQQAGLSFQSRTLAALRDTLLPKLISGEVRVPASLGSMQEEAS